MRITVYPKARGRKHYAYESPEADREVDPMWRWRAGRLLLRAIDEGNAAAFGTNKALAGYVWRQIEAAKLE